MVRLFPYIRTLLLSAALLLSCMPASADAKGTRKKRQSTTAKITKTSTQRARPSALSIASQVQEPFSTVVLDAGHGGHDPGGIPSNIIPEKNVALDVTKRVAMRLTAAGIRVVMTRSDDTFVSLPDRVSIANAESSAIFLSIHFNAGERVGARGIETFYSSLTGAPLASRIQSNLMTTTSGEDRGVKQASFYVLRNTKIRAVLTECGFLTNPDDAALAQIPEYREKLAAQIADAIIEYHRSVNRPAAT